MVLITIGCCGYPSFPRVNSKAITDQHLPDVRCVLTLGTLVSDDSAACTDLTSRTSRGGLCFPNTTAPVVGRSQFGGRPMIAFNNERNENTWQSDFVAMLPEIEQKLRLAFCRLDPEAREDAIEEGVVHSLLAYIRLHEQGRAKGASPSSLAWYSSRHVKRGRPAAGRMNGKEPLSRYGQIGNNISVNRQPGDWID